MIIRFCMSILFFRMLWNDLLLYQFFLVKQHDSSYSANIFSSVLLLETRCVVSRLRRKGKRKKKRLTRRTNYPMNAVLTQKNKLWMEFFESKSFSGEKKWAKIRPKDGRKEILMLTIRWPTDQNEQSIKVNNEKIRNEEKRRKNRRIEKKKMRDNQPIRFVFFFLWRTSYFTR